MRLYRFPSFTLLRNHVFVQSSKRFVSFSIDGGLYKIKTQRELTALLCRRRAVCLVQQGASSKKITNIKDILEGQSYEFEVIGEEKSWIEVFMSRINAFLLMTFLCRMRAVPPRKMLAWPCNEC